MDKQFENYENRLGATAAPAAKLVRVPYGQPLQGPHRPCIALLAGTCINTNTYSKLNQQEFGFCCITKLFHQLNILINSKRFYRCKIEFYLNALIYANKQFPVYFKYQDFCL